MVSRGGDGAVGLGMVGLGTVGLSEAVVSAVLASGSVGGASSTGLLEKSRCMDFELATFKAFLKNI